MPLSPNPAISTHPNSMHADGSTCHCERLKTFCKLKNNACLKYKFGVIITTVLVSIHGVDD